MFIRRGIILETGSFKSLMADTQGELYKLVYVNLERCLSSTESPLNNAAKVTELGVLDHQHRLSPVAVSPHERRMLLYLGTTWGCQDMLELYLKNCGIEQVLPGLTSRNQP
jgi:hypothetical protein